MKKSIKFGKNIFLILMMFSLVFSSVPRDSIIIALQSYVRVHNLADKFWQLKSNPNVVDNFLNSDFADLLAVHTAYAAVGDARMQYGTGTNSTPQTRFYTNATNSWSSASATVAGTANVGWTVSKESSTEDVSVMATQSTTGKLDIFCRSGATWTKDVSNVTIGTTSATRRFDVEFEKTSGIPMILYSTNTATTNELAYYRKTGAGCGAGSWTGPTTLNPTVVSGIVLWVELEARQTAGTNVMAAAFSDANAVTGGKLESMIWNGSWGNESPAGAAQGWSDLSIELQGTAGANAAKVFDLAFETNSGDLLIAWGTSTGTATVNGWRYATCSATLPCTWSGALTPAGPLDDATNVAIAPDPGSDAIAMIAQGNAGADLSAWLWTGTAVGATTAANADATLLATAAGDMHVDIDWVVSGSQRMAVGVYAETATGYKYIYYDTVGNAWRTNTITSFTITGAPATAMQSVQVLTNPNNKAQLLVSFSDSASALWSKRLLYNGAAGGATTALSTWSNADAGATLGPVSSITSMPFWFDWIRYAAPNSPPTLSVSEPNGTADTVSAGSLYNIAYSLADSDNVVTSAFYYDTNNDGIGGTAITGACATAVEGSGVTCSWNTAGVPVGTYYVYGVTTDSVNPAVTAVSPGMITIQSAGSLGVDIVNSGGTTVASPAVSFTARTFNWSAQQSTGTLGISAEKIRVSNTTGTPTWTLSIAAASGPTAIWQSGSDTYDFNGSATTGRLQINPSAITVTPQGGCSASGIATNLSAFYFAQSTKDSIDITSANGTTQTNCYWDITGIGLTQDIPATQIPGNYSLSLVLTVI